MPTKAKPVNVVCEKRLFPPKSGEIGLSLLLYWQQTATTCFELKETSFAPQKRRINSILFLFCAQQTLAFFCNKCCKLSNTSVETSHFLHKRRNCLVQQSFLYRKFLDCFRFCIEISSKLEPIPFLHKEKKTFRKKKEIPPKEGIRTQARKDSSLGFEFGEKGLPHLDAANKPWKSLLVLQKSICCWFGLGYFLAKKYPKAAKRRNFDRNLKLPKVSCDLTNVQET